MLFHGLHNLGIVGQRLCGIKRMGILCSLLLEGGVFAAILLVGLDVGLECIYQTNGLSRSYLVNVGVELLCLGVHKRAKGGVVLGGGGGAEQGEVLRGPLLVFVGGTTL